MTLAEQIQIVEDNLNEYGVCDITIEEFNYLQDELYSSGCLAGIELGKAEALNIDMDKPMHFTNEQKAWVKKYISINGERQRADGAREFAEWLCRKSDYTDIDINGFITCRCGDSPRDTTIEQALAEWQKGKEND